MNRDCHSPTDARECDFGPVPAVPTPGISISRFVATHGYEHSREEWGREEEDKEKEMRMDKVVEEEYR
jgi:hypothetical protein